MTKNNDNTERATGVDHILILVNDLEGARDYMKALGFTVTPRADHVKFGTANHLIILENVYIELLGVVNDQPEDPTSLNHIMGLLESGEGLHVIALSTDDIKKHQSHLKTLSQNVPDPQFWSREVPAEDVDELASFSTMFFPHDIKTPMQIFYCQQHTPHLIWRDEWMKHANGVTEVNKLTFPMKSPLQYIDDYKKIFSDVSIETSGKNFTFVFDNIKAEFVDEEGFEYRSITSVIHLTTTEPKGAQVTCNNLFVFEKGLTT